MHSHSHISIVLVYTALVGVYQSRDGFGYVRTRKGDNYGAVVLIRHNISLKCVLALVSSRHSPQHKRD